MFAGFPDDQIKVCASNVILGSIEVLPHNNARIPDTSRNGVAAIRMQQVAHR